MDQDQPAAAGPPAHDQDQQAAKKTRTVTAPQPEGVPLPTHVISVELAADEDVQWQWTHTTDGKSIVTGYTIIKKAEASAPPATEQPVEGASQEIDGSQE
jgi:hypothetical protein